MSNICKQANSITITHNNLLCLGAYAILPFSFLLAIILLSMWIGSFHTNSMSCESSHFSFTADVMISEPSQYCSSFLSSFLMSGVVRFLVSNQGCQ